MNPARADRTHWLAVYAGAVIWGAAESTLFFVVPDVLITWVALRSRRHALACCALALAGALAGGAVMYHWGRVDPGGVHAALLHVPAIDAQLIDIARRVLQAHPAVALIGGAFNGVPYKLFAAQAPQAGVSLATLLLLTLPARGLRFVLLALLSNAAASWLRQRTGPRVVAGLWLAAWVVEYAFYWS